MKDNSIKNELAIMLSNVQYTTETILKIKIWTLVSEKLVEENI